MASKAQKLRRKFRGIGSDRGLSGLQKDFYADFMRRRFPNVAENYAEEWADRFKHGRQWHKADKESEAALLEVMLEGPGGGTAAFIMSEDVKDAIDKKKLDEVI